MKFNLRIKIRKGFFQRLALKSNFSIGLGYTGPFNFDAEVDSNPFRVAVLGNLDEIRDTYPLVNSIDMNNFQREQQRIEEGTELIALNNYVNEKAKVDLNTLALTARINTKSRDKKFRLAGSLGIEAHLVDMEVERKEKVMLSSDVEPVQDWINELDFGYETSSSASDSKVIPGVVTGGEIAYFFKPNTSISVGFAYHLPFDKIEVGNAEADLEGYSINGKISHRF